MDLSLENIDTLEVSRNLTYLMTKFMADTDKEGSTKLSLIEAQDYAKAAYDSYSEYNKTNVKREKDFCLAIGCGNIYKALKASIRYLEGNRDIYKKVKELPDYDKYDYLYKQLFSICISSDLTGAIKILTNKNQYDREKKDKNITKDDIKNRAWQNISIFDRGFKIYDLKMLIDFFEQIMDIDRSVRKNKELNPYIKGISGKYSSLGIFISDNINNIDPETIEPEKMREYCIRVINLFNEGIEAIIFNTVQKELVFKTFEELDDIIDKQCEEFKISNLYRNIKKNSDVIEKFEWIKESGYDPTNNSLNKNLILQEGEDLINIFKEMRTYINQENL